jgi:hypothetical protein
MRACYVHSRLVAIYHNIPILGTSIDLFLQILKPAEKKQKYVYGGGLGASRPVTPPRKQKK